MPIGNRSFFGGLIGIIEKITPMHAVGSLVGLLAIGAILWVIIGGGASFLTDSQVMRGLITFSVAIVTVAIALILVFYVVFGDSDDLKDRFTYGKDILMVFVGILGTIMGFYYAENKKVGKDEIKSIADVVQKAEGGNVATDELEKKALNALIAKDFDGALKAYEDAFKVTPTLNNIDEVRKLLAARKDDFKRAADAADEAKKAELWIAIFCDISTNNKKLGMDAVMKAKVDGFCKPAANAAASPTP